MSRAKYLLTRTASEQYRRIIVETSNRFGVVQAQKYRAALRDGFKKLAAKQLIPLSPHREELAYGTGFYLHLIEHHYVAVAVSNNKTIIIAAIFHERMDIPSRLKELQAKSNDEIAALKRQLK